MADLFATKGTIYVVPRLAAANLVPYFGGAGLLNLLVDLKTPLGLVTIDDVVVSESDNLAQYSCLENKKVLYLFGENFGTIQVRCTAYMGATMAVVNDYTITNVLDKLRVSALKDVVRVRAFYKIYSFYLTNYTLGEMNHEFHSRSFTLNGVIAN